MSSGQEPGTGASPYFFLSYAHSHASTTADEFRRDRLVKRFHDDLKDAVREYAARDHATSAIDFDIPIGSRWSERISDNLARCRSFVALYSPDYFSSKHCGREWSAFAERLDTDRILRGRRPEAVIPVLWQPFADRTLPECARELQYSHHRLGPSYRQHGMAYLLRHMAEHREDYESAVQFFARRIIEVAEHDFPTPSERYPNYITLESAFLRNGGASPHPRIRIVIAAPSTPNLPRDADPSVYGSRPKMWKPYLPEFDGEISGATERLADSMGFDAFTEPFEHSGEFAVTARPSAPTLLIIDPWVVRDPDLLERLARFDADSHNKPWIRPVMPWNRERPADKAHAADLETRLAAALGQCRQRYRPESPRVLDGLETIHDFLTELPTVIRTAERFYLLAIARDRARTGEVLEPPRRRLLDVGVPEPGAPEAGKGLDRIPPATGPRPIKAFLERQRHLEIPNSEGPA